MQRVVAAAREFRVDGNQVLHIGDLARQDDAIAGQPQRLGQCSATGCRRHQCLAHHTGRVERTPGQRVLVHQAAQQVLVEAAPVHADAHRLAELDGLFDDRRELRIVLAALADVAGIDPVLCKRPRAVGKVGEQLVPVEMEIADQRHPAADGVEPLANDGNRRCRLGGIDGDAYELRAGIGQRFDLRDGRGDVRRVRVGHRLDDDRGITANRNTADVRCPRPAAIDRSAIRSIHVQNHTLEAGPRSWRMQQSNRGRCSQQNSNLRPVPFRAAHALDSRHVRCRYVYADPEKGNL